MKYIVIFVNTADDAFWAVNYKNKQLEKKILIVTLNAQAQKQLDLLGQEPYDYFNNPIFVKNFYYKSRQKFVFDAHKAFLKIYPFFTKVKILHSPFLELLKNILETEFTTIFFEYYYLQELQKKYKPNHYFIPKNSDYSLGGWNTQTFTLAGLSKQYFLHPKNISEYDSSGNNLIKRFLANVNNYFILVKTHISNSKFFLQNAFYRQFNKSTPQGKLKKSDIVLFSSGYNLYYYKNVLPKLCKKAKVTILTGEQSFKDQLLLNKSKISFHSLKSLLTKDSGQDINRKISELREFIKVTLNELRQTHPFRDYQKSLAQALYSTLEKSCYFYLKKYVQQVFLAEKAIYLTNPKLVLTTHDPAPSALPFVFAAQHKKKRAAVLLHGWHDIIIGENYISQYALVWGIYIKKWFIKTFSKSPKEILVTGFPYLDIIQKNTTLDARLKKRSYIFGLLLTLYTPNTYAQNRFFEQLLGEAYKNNFKGEFHLRVHAGQRVENISYFKKKYGIKILISPAKSLESFVCQSDIILSWDTTAMFVPMMYRKPLLYTTPLWGEGITPIKKYGAACIPQKAADVFEFIKKIEQDSNILRKQQSGQKKFLKEVVGYTGSSSSEKVANEIIKLIK